MEARIFRAALSAAVFFSLGAGYRTDNFVVNAPTAELAQEIGRTAEECRRQLAIEWTGKELPRWTEPCPITAQVGAQLGAGGATTFVFDRGQVFGWQMSVQGSRERILDSVLPHEVTHTIFATYFRQPLPRWADEGACSTIEHPEERARLQRMLVEFLQTGRGIPFARMYAMKQYPSDVLPLYAQGHSLASFLIAQGGKQKFVKYVSQGLANDNWISATQGNYGFPSLGTLQNTWLDWVRQGSPATVAAATTTPATALAADEQPAAVSPASYTSVYDRIAANRSVAATGHLVPVPSRRRPGPAVGSSPSATPLAGAVSGDQQFNGWYAKGGNPSQRDVVNLDLANEDASSSPYERPAREPDSEIAASGPPAVNQVTRPQPIERSRQIILEWSRPPAGTADGDAGPAAVLARDSRPPLRMDAPLDS
ncbi:MAG: hypothetical protein HY000_26290, partial [Planctomycetes bacterium]|nr:hypothetical protein [Planctomycetota bacterium]